MRSSRMLAIGVTALTLGTVAAIAATGIPAEAASTIHFVALGDSYSSGVGAGSTSGSCGQSPNAYPKLWAVANSVASFTFAACSGARTSDVISSQLSSLSAATTLVSITIGGNDVGFSSIMETCVLKSHEFLRKRRFRGREVRDRHAARPARRDARRHSGARAECEDRRARLPRFLRPPRRAVHRPVRRRPSGARRRHQRARRRDRGRRRGGGRHVRRRPGQFSGHELCDGARWLNSITLPIGNSYHPTATGQKDGYLPVMAAAATAVGQ